MRPALALAEVLADRAVHHLFGMRRVLEQERHVDDVDVVDDRAQRAGADAQELDCADLGLLDGLLLAAKLRRRIHLDRQAPAGCSLEFFAEAFGCRHRWVAGRLHVGGLEGGFGLCRCAGQRWQTRSSGAHRRADLEEITASHVKFLPRFIASRPRSRRC